MTSPKPVLVVAAHPDDEVLGVGGTIARHAARGDSVTLLIVGEGATSRPGGDGGAVERLREAAAAAAGILGAGSVRFLGLPDNRLDSLALLDIVQRIEEIGDTVRPAVVYTHHAFDLNVDHRIVHQAVTTAFRPLPGAGVRDILAFETVSSTEWGGTHGAARFLPQRFVDITPFLETKMQALDAYGEEMRDFPHARSTEAVRALAALRGSQAGVGAAEAFQIVRQVRAASGKPEGET